MIYLIRYFFVLTTNTGKMACMVGLRTFSALSRNSNRSRIKVRLISAKLANYVYRLNSSIILIVHARAFYA